MVCIRSIVACSLIAVLTACGGGGGGGSSSGGGGGGVTPTAPANNMGQLSVQRSDVQTSLAGVQAVREYGGGSSTALVRSRAALKAAVANAQRTALFGSAHAVPQATATSAPGCSAGSTSSTTPGANGSVIITVSTYYDYACTQIENTIVWTASQSGTIISGPATLTLYSTSGAVTQTDTGSIEFVYNSSQVLTGIEFLFTNVVANGKNQGALGVACSAASSSSTSCGIAVAADVFSSSIEDGVNVSFTASSSGATATLSMSATAYQGPVDSLAIASAALPFFSVTPSSEQTGSVSLTGTKSGSTVSLTATDSANGGSVAITGSASGSISGTVTRTDTNATVATFTVDASGNGTVTYGNGTQVSIVNYTVQG